jgi:ATP-dependent DNA ligase
VKQTKPSEKNRKIKWVKLLNQFRKDLRFRSVELEQVEEHLGRTYVITVKYDGELTSTRIRGKDAKVYNRYGRIREDFIITTEMERIAREQGVKDLVVFGELYAVDAQERPLPLNEVMSIIKNPSDCREELQMRLAVFDIYQYGKDILYDKVPYPDRFALIYTLFEGASDFIHPVAGQTYVDEPEHAVDILWKKHILDENYEGLVIRGNGAIKIKPVFTYDVAVVGMYEGKGKHKGRLGGFITAFMNSAGAFLISGKVGGGMDDEQREYFWKHLKRAGAIPTKGTKATPHYWVEPELVIEVQAANVRARPTEAFAWDGKQYLQGPDLDGFVFQQPRMLRVRGDKDISPNDLRLEQVVMVGEE